MLVVPDDSSLQRFQKLDSSILTLSQASERNIRPLHIGLVNLMPDGVLAKTEEQFLLPLHFASAALQIVPHRIKLSGIERAPDAQKYVDREYETFDEALSEGLDGLIITGANVSEPDLKKAPFWEPLTHVFSEAKENITSTFCSCLSTHAYMLHQHGVSREPFSDENKKCVGVFQHELTDRSHPLTRGMGNIIDMPHSRWNQVTENSFVQAKMSVLIKGPEAGVALATSPDGLSFVLSQGHPEYEDISLLKEYKRDVLLYRDGDAAEFPDLPKYYLTGKALDIVNQFKERALSDSKFPDFPEEEIAKHIRNSWEASRTVLFSNWLRAIYENTGFERKTPFMQGVNPKNIFLKEASI